MTKLRLSSYYQSHLLNINIHKYKTKVLTGIQYTSSALAYNEVTVYRLINVHRNWHR